MTRLTCHSLIRLVAAMAPSTLLLMTGVMLFTFGCVAADSERNETTTDTADTTLLSDFIGTLEFIESVPVETDLDMPDLAEAVTVWPELIAKAQRSVDVASFYYSRQGDGKDASAPAGTPDAFLGTLAAVSDAAARGCQVRLLGDSKFHDTYPEVLDTWGDLPNVESRILDVGTLWNGVMHAKYFLIDDDQMYIGSQNWDWRALTQIRELGALVRHPELAADLRRIYDLDWGLAGAEVHGGSTLALENLPPVVGFTDLPRARLLTARGDTVTAALAASPVQALPPGIPWDLPLMVEIIDNAETSVRIQLLSYDVSDREGRFFADLDNALRRAAARRVKVQIILANWSKSKYKLPWIKSLAAVNYIEVKFSNIPDYSRGFIPFARVEHAKYMVVDGQTAWLGTSNWSRNYFHGSRNISLLLDGRGAADQLENFFALGWNSDYAELVDPGAAYEPPRRN